MKKVHKDCILASSISLKQSLRICSCEKVQHRRQKSKQIYPFRAKDRNLHNNDCDLLRFTTRHCRTKYEELHKYKQQNEKSQKHQGKSKGKFPKIMSQSQQFLPENSLRRSPTTTSMSTISSTSSDPRQNYSSGFGPLKGSLKWLVRRHRIKSLGSLAGEFVLEDVPEETSSFSSTQPDLSKTSIANAKKTIKSHIFRPVTKVVTNDVPYGNVHMAFMLGPLIIENGIKQ